MLITLMTIDDTNSMHSSGFESGNISLYAICIDYNKKFKNHVLILNTKQSITIPASLLSVDT